MILNDKYIDVHSSCTDSIAKDLCNKIIHEYTNIVPVKTNIQQVLLEPLCVDVGIVEDNERFYDGRGFMVPKLSPRHNKFVANIKVEFDMTTRDIRSTIGFLEERGNIKDIDGGWGGRNNFPDEL